MELVRHGAQNLKVKKFEFKIFKINPKKYHGVDNVVIYHCAIF
jgi:hypothetical protein